MSLQEIKNVAISVRERISGPLELDLVQNPSLKKAAELDKEGKRTEAARHYFTLAEFSEGETRAHALIQLSQMFINLGRFSQANDILKVAGMVARDLDEVDNLFYTASTSEKRAWISDYMGNYTEELFYIGIARARISQIPEVELTEREENLISTLNHFSGRAHYGLARQSSDPDVRAKEVEAAVSFFAIDLQRLQSLREQETPHPANEGFQWAWLARCHLLTGDPNTEAEIEEAGRLFKEDAERNSGTDIMAHYHMLRGMYEIRKVNIEAARKQFELALEIRNPSEFPKGRSEALAGMALTYFAQGKFGMTFVYGLESVKTYPAIIGQTS
jgi:tetratricopeptide (TPR) repeat protein